MHNTKAETMIKMVMDTWLMSFGIPSMGSYVDDGREFVNIKMDELKAKLGITVRYRSAFSPW